MIGSQSVIESLPGDIGGLSHDHRAAIGSRGGQVGMWIGSTGSHLGSSFEIHSEEGFAGIEERIRRKMRGQQLLSASLSNLNTGTAVDGSVRVVNPHEMIIGRPYIPIKCPFLQPIINRRLL